MAPSPVTDKVSESGRLGKKNGKGFYAYEAGSSLDRKTGRPDLAVYSILGVRRQPGIVSATEIVERCVLPMVNEASRCLEEGVVGEPATVDLGMIMGTGFPAFRGGLLRYADSLGLNTVVERLRALERKLGERFRPADALVKMAEKSYASFHE